MGDNVVAMSINRHGPRRVALVSLAITVVVAAVKLGAGVASGSVGVLSDGFHSVMDAGATGLTYLAITLAAKPADREHPFGHGRAENLAALFQSVILIVVTGFVAAEAAGRLRGGRGHFEVELWVIAVALAGVLVDVGRARVLNKAAKQYSSPALAADSANFAADAATSVAVVGGLLLVRAGVESADAIAALVVVAGVWLIALRIGVQAVNVLMDRSPAGLDEKLDEAARGVRGVVDVGDVRVRRSGAEAHAEVTVSVPRTATVQESSEIAKSVEGAVAAAAPGTSAVVRVEPSREGEDVVRATFAAANRVGLADQVHNVMSIDHPEGLWLMLHAKIPASMTLSEAHGVTDLLEAELRREISGLARVEIHLEPAESQSIFGTVVSTQEHRLVSRAAEIAESYAPIVRCHEVAATRASDGLHVIAHCEAAPSQTIGLIHQASQKVESDIHREFPEVKTVTVHFEPT